MATTRRPALRRAKMRDAFYAWHGGQESALYAAASSGLVASVPALQAELRECAGHCENPATAPHSGARANALEARYLRRVADALPAMLRIEVVIRGRAYAVLPWVGRA